MMMFLMGLFILVLILSSRILKWIFLKLTFGLLGNKVSYMFLFFGYQFGKGNYLLPSNSYWPGYITIMILAFIIVMATSKNIEDPSADRTICDSAVAFNISGVVGLIIKLIF
jgi:hypothetical protein